MSLSLGQYSKSKLVYNSTVAVNIGKCKHPWNEMSSFFWFVGLFSLTLPKEFPWMILENGRLQGFELFSENVKLLMYFSLLLYLCDWIIHVALCSLFAISCPLTPTALVLSEGIVGWCSKNSTQRQWMSLSQAQLHISWVEQIKICFNFVSVMSCLPQKTKERLISCHMRPSSFVSWHNT